ncbi:sensor histidine kinase [Micromonospora sp. NPDC049559]|uniref:sensor histidine kinase n=1 Tax=Micromonospora sp. NPDC049559 TaxID=3155923 RepID=UPI003434FCA6
MTTWRRPRPDRAQLRRDLYLGLTVLAAALLDLLLLNSVGVAPLGHPPVAWEQAAWSTALALPLCWRRRFPEAVAVVTAVVFIGAQFRHNPETLVASVTLFSAIYTLGAWGPHRRRAVAIRIGIIVAMFAWLATSATLSLRTLAPDAFPDAAGPLPPLFATLLTSVLFNVAYFVFAYLYGNSTWLAARRAHELAVQAEALRRSQEELAARAVVEERVRLARELHDVVAHHVSVMGVQAAASRRVMDRDPAKAKTSLAAVEQTARTAVDELRRLLGVLRGTGPDAPAANHGLAQVDGLLDGAREAGLAVSYQTYGEPVELPDSLSLAVYRILQEALTNTIKHARATSVDVRVRYLRREVELDVTDDGHPAPDAGTAGAGMGLVGMRERVAAHEGVLEVGPRERGGFRVRARMPVPALAGTVDGAADGTGTGRAAPDAPGLDGTDLAGVTAG